MILGSPSGISPGFPELSRSCRQITHVLLTRPPLSQAPRQASKPASLDLHVLGTPPAFVLSQDQTLRLIHGIRLHVASPFPLGLPTQRNGSATRSGCAYLGVAQAAIRKAGPRLRLSQHLTDPSCLPLFSFQGPKSSFQGNTADAIWCPRSRRKPHTSTGQSGCQASKHGSCCHHAARHWAWSQSASLNCRSVACQAYAGFCSSFNAQPSALVQGFSPWPEIIRGSAATTKPGPRQ